MEETKEQGTAVVEKKEPYIVQNSEKIVASLENGTAPFLPGASGTLKEQPIRSADSGKVFHGMNQVLAQIYLKENGYQDDRICTWDQAKKSGTYIKAGAKSFPLTVYNAETKESKVYHYFPLSETGDRTRIKTPDRTPENRMKVPAIECKTADTAQYLGRYFAAMQIGSEFKASPAVQQAFRKNMLADIKAAENPISKPFEIGNRASKECREILSGMYKDAWVQARRLEREQERIVERKERVKEPREQR
jgi:hypothetical protein